MDSRNYEGPFIGLRERIIKLLMINDVKCDVRFDVSNTQRSQGFFRDVFIVSWTQINQLIFQFYTSQIFIFLAQTRSCY
jgi:hypothetical protein